MLTNHRRVFIAATFLVLGGLAAPAHGYGAALTPCLDQDPETGLPFQYLCTEITGYGEVGCYYRGTDPGVALDCETMGQHFNGECDWSGCRVS